MSADRRSARPRTDGAKPAPSRNRELRAQGKRTRRRLLDAGRRTFRDRGYHATRVDDIVRAARTSHGTFYLYFANKEELLGALAEECAEHLHELAAGIGPVTRDDAGAAVLEEFVRDFAATYRRYGPVIRAWMEGQVEARSVNRLGVKAFRSVATALAERMSETGVTGGLEVDHAVAALMALLERVAYATSSRRIEMGHDELATLARFVHRGFFGAPLPA